ncbi:glycoside hydrolase family 13 protein [Planococcus lenghuensis]|uniref:oligo-1,6-glucosidase n=1 Tax=Planococcus lenghuensis TaxID=2213202 RepID=A0A1Q2KWM0_9BACL|nr:alpha-glucosidase [Planococcus lenghuensis]AQQ52072.1 glucohydrolase [Planococcus lenghuensis]
MEKWWKRAVVYQVYPRSFMDTDGDGIGDLNGITEKLDYIAELGADVIWLSPVYDSPNDDNGYDIRDYQSIMTEFGTMEDFDRLLAEAHARGLKLIMDLVINHTSDEHEWFRTKPEYYIWRDKPNNWQSFFSGTAWAYDEVQKGYYLHLFSKKQPDLNWENEEMREELYTMMRWWLDKGVDGFRMDVINMISKDPAFPEAKDGDGNPHFLNGPEIHRYLREMNDRVLSHYDIVTVGEMPGTSPEHARAYTREENKELNMIFTFEHMELDQTAREKWNLKKLDLRELKANMEKWQHALHEEGWNSLYWNNHDQPRIVSRFGNDGEYRVESAKMLGACLHFMQGTPYIYQGEELGMTNVKFDSIEEYEDIETRNMYSEKLAKGIPPEKIMPAIWAKGRDNARTPMQWSNEPNAGFTKGTPWLKVNPSYPKINAACRNEEGSIFSFYQSLIRLRKKLEVITNGTFTLLHREHPAIFAYERETKAEKITVCCNFSNQHQLIARPNGKLLLSNYKEVEEQPDLFLRPYETAVFYSGPAE